MKRIYFKVRQTFRSALRVSLDVDYWLLCLSLLLASSFLLRYCSLIENATDSEVVIVFLRAQSFLTIFTLMLGFVAVKPTSESYARIAGSLAGLLLGLMWLDLHLYQLTKLHLPHVLRILHGGDLRTMMKSIALSGLSLREVALYGCLAPIAALIGYLAARPTSWFCNRAPLQLARSTLASACLIALGLHLALQVLEFRMLRSNIQSVVAATVPFRVIGAAKGTTRRVSFSLPERLPIRSSPLPPIPPKPERTPQVLLVVVESLRADAVQQGIMPNLWAFREDCLRVTRAVSTGNATQLGWFSLLTGDSPLRFEQTRMRTSEYGSWPFRVLKSYGYSTLFLSSLSLDYYALEQIAFGPRSELLDERFDSRDFGGGEFLTEIDVAARDVAVTEKLLSLLEDRTTSKPRCFIVSYNSSHHPYFFPRSAVRFSDYLETWDYAKLSNDLAMVEGVRRKYYNALAFLDYEIGRIFSALRATDEYRDALIVVLGDHGEEFMEHKSMFHNGSLTAAQIEIPILIKFPSSAHSNLRRTVVSTMDVLPTVLHEIGAYELIKGRCDGVSLLEGGSAVAIAAAGNGASDPSRFCLISDRMEAYFQFIPGTLPSWSNTEVWLDRLVWSDESPPVGERSQELPRRLPEDVFLPFERIALIGY